MDIIPQDAISTPCLNSVQVKTWWVNKLSRSEQNMVGEQALTVGAKHGGSTSSHGRSKTLFRVLVRYMVVEL